MLYDPNWKVEETETKVAPWRQILLDAVKIMDERGWIRGALQDHDGVCSIGALRIAQYGSVRCLVSTRKYPHKDYRIAQQKLRKVIGRRSIIKWNDGFACGYTQQSQNSVRNAFLKAANLED